MNRRRQDGPVRIALIGAGLFARKAHIPALNKLSDRFRIVAICTRSHQSAEVAAGLVPHGVTIYDDIPSLLALEKLDAVDVALPIHLMPGVVARCLEAGVHVISEKPVAPTLEQAIEMVDAHDERGDQVWMVAENWRYERAFQVAAERVRSGAIGAPVSCDWSLQLPVHPHSPNHRTTWRRANRFPGGFLLDGGVHHVAALRLVLGEIIDVCAFCASHREDLPPADTLVASLRFASGAVGSYSVTYAAASSLSQPSLHIVGSQGSLRVEPDRLQIWRSRADQAADEGGAHEMEEITFPPHGSVLREFQAFADAIAHGAPHDNSSRQALQDLAVIEAMLTSADGRGTEGVRRFV